MRLLCRFDWSPNILPCTIEYHPDKPADIIQNPDGTFVFNSYLPPRWYFENHYYQKAPIEIKKLPEIYQNFFKHLLDGDNDSIEYVLDWLSTMLTSKNLCYLSTIGMPGVGKGTLGELICALVGNSNYATMGFNSITKQFNSQIENRKALYFDEVKIKNTDQELTLRLLVNDTVEVERKNQDSRCVKNFASIYLSSNDYGAIKLQPGDRRFSIVNLTKTKLNEVFDKETRAMLFDEDNIKILGNYLLKREVDFEKMSRPFISNNTRAVQQASLAEWEDCLLNSIAITEAGKKLPWLKVKDMIVAELGRSLNAGKQAVNDLAQRLPGFYTFKREVDGTGRKIYMISFASRADQPTHLLENVSVSED